MTNFLKRKILSDDRASFLDLKSILILSIASFVIYPYSILNSALNFHSYFTLQFQCLPIPYSDVSDISDIFQCFRHFPTFPTFSDVSDVFWCFPYSNVFLFCTPMFPTFPAVFWCLSALWCFPYSDVSEILLFHSIPSPCSDVFWCFPHFYRCGTFSVTSWTIFPKHHNLRSIMDSLRMQ